MKIVLILKVNIDVNPVIAIIIFFVHDIDLRVDGVESPDMKQPALPCHTKIISSEDGISFHPESRPKEFLQHVVKLGKIRRQRVTTPNYSVNLQMGIC